MQSDSRLLSCIKEGEWSLRYVECESRHITEVSVRNLPTIQKGGRGRQVGAVEAFCAEK